MMSEHEWIRIAFDGPPSHESGRFVEVETEHGNSISFGEWVEGENGLWYLQFPNHANEHAALKRENEELKAELREERKRLLLELYNNSAISQFQFDIAMKELELLTTEEPTP